MYSALFRVLQQFDPELTHELGMGLIRFCGLPGIHTWLRRRTAPPAAHVVNSMGLTWGSPVGVAAGFDKNAVGVRGLYALGFDHVEVGTVTPRGQDGNPRPRLFRLTHDAALINRMGFNNRGAEAMARRLAKLRRSGGDLPIIGVNIGKNLTTPVDEATGDYVSAARSLAPYADYLVVNVSSPNTPGLRGLQTEKTLRPLLAAVLQVASGTPVLVKIAPELSPAQIGGVARLVMELGLAGIVATNTTTSRKGLHADRATVDAIGDGGLSGKPLAQQSRDVLGLIRQTLPRNYAIVSVGGVFTGEDVAERLSAGANLVQAYTGFVYRGPLFARHLTRELATAATRHA